MLKFHEDFRGAPDKLRAYLRSDRWRDVERLVHTVKGASATIGALALHDAARRFEENLKAKELGGYEAFQQALAAALACIGSHVPVQPAAGRTVDSQSEPSGVEFDAAVLLPRLRELQTLLAQNRGQARAVAKEIASSLAGTAPAEAFGAIEALVRQLNFKEASEALRALMASQVWGEE
jgi:HPt (histidine-containing phosphotransfer) domain-containing protein